MADAIQTPLNQWPEAALQSIYKAYPRMGERKRALTEIRSSLERICNGEIDGNLRTRQQAIEFLRERTERAARDMSGRQKKWIPLASTWFHQSRYLKTDVEDSVAPTRMQTCIDILGAYPHVGAAYVKANLRALMPTLLVVEKCLVDVESEKRAAAASWLLERVTLYAKCVATWPVADLHYVPGAKRWFEEKRYGQSEALWLRKSPAQPNFQAERDQIGRLYGSQ